MNTNTERYELNKQLAQMLKGGVIMDVTTPEQAKIAEEAGACAVMALERIPADIRAAGGVSRIFLLFRCIVRSLASDSSQGRSIKSIFLFFVVIIVSFPDFSPCMSIK